MVTPTWVDLFGEGPVAVDGGLSTQLTRMGQDVSGSLWTGRVLLHDPGAVTKAHAAFIAAGADIVITASYQVSRAGFRSAGLTEADADSALVASVTAARAATGGSDRPVRLAASVGPYGAILHDGSEYRGNYGLTHRQLVDFHRARIDVLLAQAPDLLAIETIPDAREAEALMQVLDDAGGPPSWVTFSAVDGGHVCAGQSIEECAAIVAGSSAVIATGVNCTDPAFVAELLGRLAAATDLPLVAYPNAGGDWDPTSGEWHGDSLDDGTWEFSSAVLEEWRAAGAVAIGGCCGTDERTIRQVSGWLARPGS